MQLYMGAILSTPAHAAKASKATGVSTVLVAVTSRLPQDTFGIGAIANLEPVVSLRVAQVERRGSESGGELVWGANSGENDVSSYIRPTPSCPTHTSWNPLQVRHASDGCLRKPSTAKLFPQSEMATSGV